MNAAPLAALFKAHPKVVVENLAVGLGIQDSRKPGDGSAGRGVFVGLPEPETHNDDNPKPTTAGSKQIIMPYVTLLFLASHVCSYIMLVFTVTLIFHTSLTSHPTCVSPYSPFNTTKHLSMDACQILSCNDVVI